MPSLDALFPASSVGLSGFVLLRFWIATRALHRIEPPTLYAFWVAVTGLGLLLICAVLVVFLDQLWLQIDCRLLSAGKCNLDLDFSALEPTGAQWTWASILSLPLAVSHVVVLRNGRIAKWTLRRILVQDLESNALGRLALMSSETDPSLPISLNLDNGHVIIGYPVSLESFANSSVDVDVLPFASGFRDQEQKLRIRTNYRWIYELSEAEQETFVKPISRDRIISANLFDEKKWLAFGKHQKTGN